MTAQEIERAWSNGWRALAARWLADARALDPYLTDREFADRIGIPPTAFSALMRGKRSWIGYAARLVEGVGLDAGDGLNKLLEHMADQAARAAAAREAAS